MQNIVFTVLLLLTLALLQACSSQQSGVPSKSETSSTTTSPSPPADQNTTTATPSESAVSNDYIEIDKFRFKLAPDIQKDGVAHLDFYVRDKSDKHIKGVTGTFHVTKPDGTKIEIPIKEETPHDHYHGMIKLDQAGEYLIVAQVSIEGKKLNPRFSFSRN